MIGMLIAISAIGFAAALTVTLAYYDVRRKMRKRGR